MTETPVAKLILSLGIPTTGSMLITNIYNMADSYFVSQVSLSAGGATGIVFGLSTCTRALCYGRKPLHTERPCPNHHLGQCCAPCTGRIREDEYAERVAGAVDLLTRGSGAMIASLQEQMNEAAENLEFEKAAKLRDRIAAIVEYFEEHPMA